MIGVQVSQEVGLASIRPPVDGDQSSLHSTRPPEKNEREDSDSVAPADLWRAL